MEYPSRTLRFNAAVRCTKHCGTFVYGNHHFKIKEIPHQEHTTEGHIKRHFTKPPTWRHNRNHHGVATHRCNHPFQNDKINDKPDDPEKVKVVDEFMKSNRNKIHDFTIEEGILSGIISKLPNNKATGYTTMNYEMFKYGNCDCLIKIIEYPKKILVKNLIFSNHHKLIWVLS